MLRRKSPDQQSHHTAMDGQGGGQQPITGIKERLIKDLVLSSGCVIHWLLPWMILPVYPVFTQTVNQPPWLVVTERQTAILNCSTSTVFFKGTVSWFRITQDGKERVYPSNSNLRFKDRVYLDSEAFRTNGEATITILNVSLADSGVYVCQIREVMAQNIQKGNGTLLTVLSITQSGMTQSGWLQSQWFNWTVVSLLALVDIILQILVILQCCRDHITRALQR